MNILISVILRPGLKLDSFLSSKPFHSFYWACSRTEAAVLAWCPRLSDLGKLILPPCSVSESWPDQENTHDSLASSLVKEWTLFFFFFVYTATLKNLHLKVLAWEKTPLYLWAAVLTSYKLPKWYRTLARGVSPQKTFFPSKGHGGAFQLGLISQ